MSKGHIRGAVENTRSGTSVLEVIIENVGLAAVRSNPELASFSTDFSAFLDGLNRWVSDAINAWREVAEQYRPLIESLALFVTDVRIADTISETGLIPHIALWPHFVDIDGLDDAGRKEIATEAWTDIRPRLELTNAQCFNDQRLTILFTQMLDCQETGQYEIVCTALPSVIERAIRLTETYEQKMNPKKWLQSEFVTLSALADVDALWVWQILVEESYSQCRTDDAADAIRYPNRHALAHGVGSNPATCADSLNAILLANSVIRLARSLNGCSAEKFS